jgi:hypothetical protein
MNGYPVVSTDSGTYLHGYSNITSLATPPYARPIFYSIFVYISSFGKAAISFVALAQDALMAFLLSELFADRKFSFSTTYILMIFYLPISYVAVLSNTIGPDIWLGMAFIAIYLIATHTTRKPFSVLLVILCCTLFAPANGIILLFSVFCVMIFMVLARMFRTAEFLKLFIILVTIALGLLGNIFDDYYAYKILSPIADSNTFFVARLTADHLAQNSINKLCHKHQYSSSAACVNRQQYLSRGSQQFLWRPYKNGFYIWSLQNQKFFGAVKKRTLTRHWMAFSLLVLDGGLKTLTIYPKDMGKLYFQHNKPSDLWICKDFGCGNMMSAWQQTDKHSFGYFRLTNLLLFILTVYTLIAFRKAIIHEAIKFTAISVFAISCIIFNALIDGGLSLPFARYNIKGIGVIPVLLCFMIVSIYFDKPAIDNKT